MTIDPALLAVFTRSPTPQAAISVLLVAVPPNLPPRVQGEVVSIDVKLAQAVIRTAQGEVVVQTDAALQVGQKVDIRVPPQIATPNVPTTQQSIPATLVTLPVVTGPPAPPPSPAPLPPAVQLDVPLSNPGAAAPVPQAAAQAYQAPVVASTTLQPLAQLAGQDVPATVLQPQQGTTPSAASVIPNTPPQPDLTTPVLVQPGGNLLSPLGGERVQIAFIGTLLQATEALQKIVQQNTGQPISVQVQNTAAMPSGIAVTPSTLQPATVTNTGIVSGAPLLTIPNAQSASTLAAPVPVLAQLMGLTPQNLPVFQTIPFVMPDGQNFLPPQNIDGGQKTMTVPDGARIIVHTPVTVNQGQDQSVPTAALLVRLPAPLPSPSQQFALEELPQLAPLFSQLLQDPGSVIPAALAAQAANSVPKPGTPRFAMSLAMSILGLTAPNGAENILPRAVLDALKPEQKTQLQKELHALSTVTREGVQQAEGMRVNFPVEMGGQLYLWQMTLRSHDQNKENGAGSGLKELPTRFILDLYMSNMGPVQVDGLAFSKSRRLDVVMRTQWPFDDSVQKMLHQESFRIFENARLTGSLEFQILPS